MYTLQQISAPVLQRKCDCGHAAGHKGECEDCTRKRKSVQRFAEAHATATRVPSLVQDVLQSPGRSLDPETRSDMQARLGHDFSQVRVHADRRAAESARAVKALAYTVGRDVVFAQGRFAPGTAEGRRLLAHELAHVIQQEGASESFGLPSDLQIDASDAAEEQAETAARATSGSFSERRPFNLPPVLLQVQRQGEEGEEGHERVQTAEDCASDCQSYCPDLARHFILDHWPEWDPIVASSACDFGPGRLWTCPVELTLISREKPDCTETYKVTVVWNGDGHRLRVHTGPRGGVTVYDYACGDGLQLTQVAEPRPHVSPNPYTCL